MKNRSHNNILFIRDMDENEDYRGIDVVCRGCAMRGRENMWHNFVSSIGDEQNREIDNSYLMLEEEPDNEYDPNAIMVICRGEMYGVAGYIGREYTGKVKEVLQKCSQYRLDMLNENQAGEREIWLALRWTEGQNGKDN